MGYFTYLSSWYSLWELQCVSGTVSVWCSVCERHRVWKWGQAGRQWRWEAAVKAVHRLRSAGTMDCFARFQKKLLRDDALFQTAITSKAESKMLGHELLQRVARKTTGKLFDRRLEVVQHANTWHTLWLNRAHCCRLHEGAMFNGWLVQ